MVHKLYELIDPNRGQTYQDFTDGMEIRKAWWGFQPYDSPDGEPGFVNEDFIRMVEQREHFIMRRPIYSLHSLAEEFTKAMNNLNEYVKRAKDGKKFFKHLTNLQESLLEQGVYEGDKILVEIEGFNRLEYVFENILKLPVGKIYSATNEAKIRKYLAKNPKDAKTFNMLYEDGASKFSTIISMGRHDFPTFDNRDSSPSIENDLNANSAMYTEDKKWDNLSGTLYNQTDIEEALNTLEEDLEYNHVDDATKDKFTLSENMKLVGKNSMGKAYLTDVKDDMFIHFAPKKIAIQIAKTKKLDPSFSKIFGEAVFAISLTYGKFYPDVQIHNIGGERSRDHNDYVGIVFTTKAVPEVGHAEEVVWHGAIDIRISKYLTVKGAENLLKKAPYRLNENDFVIYDKKYVEELNEERKKAWTPGSKAVTVKKKCRLGGLGNTSAACNQGDINNLEFSSLNENNIPYGKDFWAWVSPEDKFIQVPKLRHKEYIEKIYPDLYWDMDAMFDKAFDDGWVRVIYEYDKNRFYGDLSLNGKDESRIKDVFKKFFFDSVKYGNNGITMGFNDTDEWKTFSTYDSDTKAKLANFIAEVAENLDEVIEGGEYEAYHGSPNEIKSFSDEFVGAEEATDQEGPGIYFTTNQDDARAYGPFIHKVKLNPRKLVDETSHEDVDSQEIINLIKQSPDWEMNATNWDEDPETGLYNAVNSFMQYSKNEKDLFQQVWYDFFRYHPVEFVREMVKLGYDGQYIEKPNGQAHIIVYNPQIVELQGVEKDSVEEGVGDKYVEKKYNMEPEFSDFEKRFRSNQNVQNKEEIIPAEKGNIIKNPTNLNNIGAFVRGVIDKEGNLYVEEDSIVLHDEIIRTLDFKRRLKYQHDWDVELPEDYITVHRFGNTNNFVLGESNMQMRGEELRYGDEEYWKTVPTRDEAKPYFQKFIDKANSKHKNINFVNEIAIYYREGESYDDFRKELGLMNEGEIMSLNDLPFKADVEQLGGKIFSVGGAVRDEFLGKESKDLDILVSGIPMEQLSEIMSKYGKVNAVGQSFGILKFTPPGGEEVDVAIPRTEVASGDGGHKGFDVTSDHSLPIEDDLKRRDFTINAIAKDASGRIIDPYGGQQDLQNKIIRIVNPEAFADDALRMLRAVQFASRFGFTIEPKTMEMIQNNAAKIKEIPPERILTEFDKIVKKGNKMIGAQLLQQTGLYGEIFNGKPINVGEEFNRVRTMGEFIYLLTRSMPNPAEHYKQDLKGEIDTYKEIKALDIGMEHATESNVSNRSIAHNMYTISPKSIESRILPQKLQQAAMELQMGRFPKTIGELAVNGKDLQEAGFQGKEIGNKLKSLLINIYAENVRNEKEDLLKLVGKKEIKENVLYTGVVLDKDSHDKLVTRFKKFIPEDWEIKAHHMTIKFGEADEDLKAHIKSKEDVRLEVVSFAKDDLVAAVGVTGFKSDREVPHVTLAVNKAKGGTPGLSKNLKDWTALPTPFVITGKVEEIKEDSSNSVGSNQKPLNESKYSDAKASLSRSKSIPKEMKEKIGKYMGGGSTYHEGGRVHGLKIPKVKGKRFHGVSLGADKKGFYVYTHRAASKRYDLPDKIPQKDIDFIESTG